MATMPMAGGNLRFGGGDTTGGGSNQYFSSLPSLPTNFTPQRKGGPVMGQGWAGTPMMPSTALAPSPGTVPPQGGGVFDPNSGFFPGQGGGWQGTGPVPTNAINTWLQNNPLGSGLFQQASQYPGLSAGLANFLESAIGQGVSPFNLQAALPTGGTTDAGQLSAPMNQLLQQLFSAYGGGQSNVPGANALNMIASQGVSALPEWQSMIQAQQQNIQDQQANLREQFASMGDLAGSPFGNAMQLFQQGTTASQNALLGQLTQQNLLQGQLPVAENLLAGASGMGQYGQGLDQQAIQNLYNEFIRTSPQYNPLLQEAYGLATTYAPIYSQKTGQGVLGGLLSNIGGLGSHAGGSSSGGGTGGAFNALGGIAAMMCHVAASFYGWDSWKTRKIRTWLVEKAPRWFANFYAENGEWIARTPAREAFKPLFEAIVAGA